MVVTLPIFLILGLFQTARCDFPKFDELDMAAFIEGHGTGYTVAYGDVNADRQTDLFVLQDSGNLSIFTGSETAPALRSHLVIPLGDSATSVVPADFDGDENSDILVTYKDGEHYTMAVFWNIEDNKHQKNRSVYTEKLVDEPLVMDVTGDMISDLFVVFPNNSRGFLIGQLRKRQWKFLSWSTTEDVSAAPMYIPHSHAFIDLTDDGSADLFVTTKDKDDAPLFEVWKGTRKGLSRTDLIHSHMQDKKSIFGHATFADFTGNAKQDIVISTCVVDDSRCTDSKILIYTNKQWHTLMHLKDLSFPVASGFKHIDNTLHIADVNLDSHPDLMTIVEDAGGFHKAVIFYNIPCESDYCSDVKRQLGKRYVFNISSKAIHTSFYDFDMDGSMDVIISTQREDKTTKMKAFKNRIADDVTFLKVQVLTGISENAYYVNVPGPQIIYETTNDLGGSQRGCLAQLSQSAHLSLQLPYVIFGLGRLANFVEDLTVSIPVPLIADSSNEVLVERLTGNDKTTSALSANFKPQHYTWTMLIPNSQLYVIPHPLSSPSSWSNRLLVTPGQNVITTGLVLLVTCGVLMLATMVLHYLEKREDKQEKIQEAHKFHFDAM